MSEEMSKKDEQVGNEVGDAVVDTVVKKPCPSDDFVRGPGGDQVYDKGEAITTKMSREKAVFDKDLFFQELYEDYLICVQRGAERQKPGSHVLLRWDLSTTFEDFLNDSVEHLDKQLESVKYAKAIQPKKFETIGDSVLDEAKLDEGSSQVGKQFNNEDYDAVHELLRRSKEAIFAMRSGKIQMVINEKTGRVRVITPGNN